MDASLASFLPCFLPAVALPGRPAQASAGDAAGFSRAPGLRPKHRSGPRGNRILPHINQREADQSDDQLNPAVFSHHLIADRIWISGQANFIFQAHDAISLTLRGTNSFQSRVEMTALSRVLTLYTGIKITRWTEFVFDAEEAGGKGLSEALGDRSVPQSRRGA